MSRWIAQTHSPTQGTHRTPRATWFEAKGDWTHDPFVEERLTQCPWHLRMRQCFAPAKDGDPIERPDEYGYAWCRHPRGHDGDHEHDMPTTCPETRSTALSISLTYRLEDDCEASPG
jgi:hypothetical protein